MANSVVPSQADVFTALRYFITTALPLLAPENCILGQVNRVPEPTADDFVVMWPITLTRLATNLDTFEDVRFTGNISGTTLLATLISGTIEIGDTIFGIGVAAGTTIISVIADTTGGAMNESAFNVDVLNAPSNRSSYVVSVTQTVTSELMSSGRERLAQDTDIVIQVDVHGPSAMDNSQIITTLMRDNRGVEIFADSGYPVIPLYAVDPVQLPFTNAENQYEDRYAITIHLEADRNFTLPQQFADEINTTFIDAAV